LRRGLVTAVSLTRAGGLLLNYAGLKSLRGQRTDLRSALWTVAHQLADECRASPDGGQLRGLQAYRAVRTFPTASRAREARRTQGGYRSW